MDYKLKKSEFYRIGYLLAGLFMFLFLFCILNLSSHALANQTISLNLLSQHPTSSKGSCSVNIGSPSFNVTIPANSSLAQDTSLYYSYGYKFTATTTSGNFDLYSGNSGFTAVQYVNSSNSFVSSLNVPSNIGSFFLNGQLISVDFELSFTGSYSGSTYLDHINIGGTTSAPSSLGYGSFQSNNYGYAYGSTSISVPTFNLSKNTNFVTSASSSNGSSDGSSFVQYSSYVPVPLLNNSTVNGQEFLAESPFSFSFPDYNSNSFTLSNSNLQFYRSSTSTKYLWYLSFIGSFNPSSFTTYISDRGSNTVIWLSSSNLNSFPITINGQSGTFLYYEFELPSISASDIVVTYLSGVNATNISNVSYGIKSYSLTLNDYMDYVKNNWDAISPSVSTTNQNISQSVSDIGTAQTFETSAFTDFDSSMNTSGLDTFSLSFNSTPLLWCASIINTFYNNMPSGFQYLLMFVAFIGILVIVLNIAGRVVRRFGGE